MWCKNNNSNLAHKHEEKIEETSQKKQKEKITLSPISGRMSLGMRILFFVLCTIMLVLAMIIVVLLIDFQRPSQENSYLYASMENMESGYEVNNADFISENESTETIESIINNTEIHTTEVTEAEPEFSETVTMEEFFSESLEEPSSELREESSPESLEENSLESTIESALSKHSMSPSEIEEEVQRIKNKWAENREAVANGSFTREQLDGNTIFYFHQGDLRMIEISGNENELLTKILQVENGKLTFAYYGTAQGQMRCYFKDSQMFRWIQTDADGNTVVHDMEQENQEFTQHEQQIVNDFQMLLDYQ